MNQSIELFPENWERLIEHKIIDEEYFNSLNK